MCPALNDKQLKVHDWLNNSLSLPLFAEVYKGAVTLLSERPPGYISFVAHAGRDLINRLAPTVAGVKSGRVQYVQLLDNLQDKWKDEWGLGENLSGEAFTSGRTIPIEVCKQISALIDEHKSGRLRSSQVDALFFSTFLDYADKDKIPNNFLSEWKTAKDWFLKHAHLRNGPYETESANDVVMHFSCLDGYLYIAASSQYDRLKALNEILDETNQ